MPGKRAARSSDGRRSMRRAVIIAVVGLLTLLVGWSATAVLTSDDTNPSTQARGDATASHHPSDHPSDRSSDSAPSSPAAEPTSANTPTESAGSARALRTCAADLARAESVVDAAATGVDHWHSHVQARTDMLSGAIEPDEMKELWSQTRLAGPEDQKRFDAALQEYGAASTCDDLGEDGPDQAKVSDCIARSKAATRAVSAGEDAMGDWLSHLDHMAAYAQGEMDQDEAQREWVQAWRNAPVNISKFTDARAALAAGAVLQEVRRLDSHRRGRVAVHAVAGAVLPGVDGKQPPAPVVQEADLLPARTDNLENREQTAATTLVRGDVQQRRPDALPARGRAHEQP